MKHILRSPIEPEFAYFVKTAFRKKREALQSRFQSEKARFSAFFKTQKKSLTAAFRVAQENIRAWREKFQSKFTVPEKQALKEEKEESPVVSKSQASPAFPAPVIRSITVLLEVWKKRAKSIEWKEVLRRRPILISIFVLALLSGMGVKAIARDSLVIGFEDYKLSGSENMVDLNAVQKRMLSDDWTPVARAFEGEQCTE